MDLQQLRYFKKTAELEHMTKAACELLIAQPSLSKTIRGLEEELGAPLFEREKKRIHLNSNGKILLDCVNRVEQCLQNIQTDLEHNRQTENRQVTLLLKSTPIILPKVIQQFCEENPGVNFRMLTYNTSLDESKLEYDFLLDSSSQPVQDSGTLNFLYEEMVLAVPQSHPLARRPSIALRDAREEPFVCLPSSYAFHHEFLHCCRTAGFRPNIVLESSDHFTILGMIEAELGIALVPAVSWGFQNTPGVAFVRVKEPACRNVIYLSWNPQRGLSESCRLFLEYMRAFAEHPEDFLENTPPLGWSPGGWAD